MRVIHSGSCNVLAGGPALSTWLTLKGLRSLDIQADLVTSPIVSGELINKSINPYYTNRSTLRALAYVPQLNKTLDKAGHADLYHVQGLWMYHGTQVAQYALKHNKPYVVTLRGMMYPEALAKNSIFKKIALLTYQGRTLKQASAIQCTCIEEKDYYRKLGYKNPVAVIPNPIETEDIIDRPISQKEIFRIGYLGRIHPRKRIERLIYAMHQLRNQLPNDAELMIIGGGDTAYEKFLHDEVERLRLDNVRFTGFISGKEKDDAILSLSLLVVPSDFENFGNIVTEALVRGVPVIASTGMPWQELPQNHCGWWVSNSQNSINQTILEAYTAGPEILREMGQNGKTLMKQCYSVDSLGRKMKALYEWILGNDEKPEFVFID